MITDMSPIFGLSLLELMEWLTIIAGFGSLVVAGAILYTHRGQKKIASANLVFKYKGAWRHGGEFIELLGKIKNTGAVVDPNQDYVWPTLDHFEDIAILWNQDVLDFNQVKEFFGTNLTNIKNNDSLMSHLKDANKNYSHYANLLELLKKI